MSEGLSVSWDGRVVGWIGGPRFDFPHWYGQWVPAESEATDSFLSVLRQAVDDGDGLAVVLGDAMPATVYVHPSDENGAIDVRLH